MVCNDDDEYKPTRSKSQIERSDIINLLMQKHTLLAFISVISAISAYILFDLFIFTATSSSQSTISYQYGFLFLDIDMVIKSITCILMFKFYERKFLKLCWCCIRIFAIECSCCCKSNASHYQSLFEPLFEKAEGNQPIIHYIYINIPFLFLFVNFVYKPFYTEYIK